MSDEQIAELTQLETLDNTPLKQLLLKTLSKEQQALETLLQKNKARVHTEQKQLVVLQKVVNKIMLQKARAAVLLRFRGQRLPYQQLSESELYLVSEISDLDKYT